MCGMAPTGLTEDAGWQAGVRRTFPVAQQQAWALLTSAEGQGLWLGGTLPALEPGTAYALPDGTRGEVRAASDRHLRLTWEAPGWAGESTLQLRARPAATGTTISFHHERLAGADERERALAHWTAVLAGIGERLAVA